MQINYAKKEVSCKLVYYGPGMSGKTTNLEIIHKKAPEKNKGELTSIATEGDRTLFFDFLPLDLGQVRGLTTKFQLYTVPGQVYYASTRKLVLQGADGVIFVADSAADKIEENIESLNDLETNLKEYTLAIEELPILIQWNKRDLPNALSVDELEAKINRIGAPTTEAVAATGEGVLATLKMAASMVLDRLNSPDAAVAAPAQARPAAPKKELYVAQVNDDKISSGYFSQYCQIQYRLNARSENIEDFKKFNLDEKKKLLESLINYALLLQDAKRRSITVEKDELGEKLGKFAKKFESKAEMKNYLARRNLTADNLANEATRNIIIGKMISEVVPGFAEKMKISDGDVRGFYEENKALFGSRRMGAIKDELVPMVKMARRKSLLEEFFQQLRSAASIEIYEENID